ncbi:hypothetical protein Ciccas_012886 [Cichlidogyrus casuarinus]|uniref:Uncharacterized protein n=1 Tax=Cichlidogyrus casuarinus TaxID=1844966 RepID=A0ABD2PM53_9PLAT
MAPDYFFQLVASLVLLIPLQVQGQGLSEIQIIIDNFNSFRECSADANFPTYTDQLLSQSDAEAFKYKLLGRNIRR